MKKNLKSQIFKICLGKSFLELPSKVQRLCRLSSARICQEPSAALRVIDKTGSSPAGAPKNFSTRQSFENLRFENRRLESGTILIQVFVFGMIAVLVIGALVSWAGTNIKAARNEVNREQAIEIAEAGTEYYRWHLAHVQNDFQDGSTTPNVPYVHNYYDKDGNLLGTFTLNITAPLVGSTLVTILSQGKVTADPTVSRKIQVKLGMPSIAKYAMVTNSAVYYGSGDNVYGPVHSNVGVGFWSGSPQPIAHNLVTAAVSSFDGNFGVYTTVPTADTGPNGAVPSRPDVFAGGRQFPVPAVDFTGITADLSAMKTLAQVGGFYRASSGANGYDIVLKTNGTFDLYKINSLLPSPNSSCANNWAGGAQTGWGTWSINTATGATTLLGNYAFPTNGIMFFEDNIWVEGQINHARLTIAAGTFPVSSATYKQITVNNNLLYTNFDGTDSIGLIAQGNFLVGLNSQDSLTIDGALIAQNGGTIRYYYGSSCGTNLRTTLTTFGMFGSNQQGYFYYGDGVSGYLNQPAAYDANMLYSPPPSFPLTGNQYQPISWQILQ